jgi:Uma2 family endonuclease
VGGSVCSGWIPRPQPQRQQEKYIDMSVAPMLPPPYERTAEEYDALPADGVRRELVEGVLHVSPSPISRHQRAAMRLAASLDAGAPANYAVLEGEEIKLAERLRYIPDVLVVTAEAYGDGYRSQYLPQEVVLAIEIVSASSRGMDRILKPHHYVAAGIPHYWRIEFEPETTVYPYVINEHGEYQPVGVFRDTLRLDTPWPIDVDLKRLTR